MGFGEVENFAPSIEVAREVVSTRRAGGAELKNTVILSGVSPGAQAGAKRSEESLTETRAEAAGGNTRPPVPAASARFCQRFLTARRPACARAALRSE